MIKLKLFFVLAVITSMTISCGSTAKFNNAAEKTLKGNWEITNVSFKEVQNNHVNANLFGHGPLDCFVGSNWQLIPNNATGSYTLSGTGCDSQPMNITWYIQNDNGQDYFWFKQVGNLKAKKVATGYKLKYLGNTGTTFTLEQELPFEGNKITAVYSFNKIN